MNVLLRIVVTILLLAGGGGAAWYGWRAWEGGTPLQSTGDAYVRGEITVLAPRVSGYIVGLLADDNEAVTAHQTLLRIDPRDYTLAVERAEAAVQVATAQLERAEVSRRNQALQVAAADANVQAAQAQQLRNTTDLARARELRAGGAGTQVRVDDSTAAEQASRAALLVSRTTADLQRQGVEQVDADARLARANLASARASLRTAQLALEDTDVWAPIAGIVANRRSRIGEYVVPGTRMLSIVPTDGLWIDANFRETQLTRMRPDQPVRITLDMHSGRGLCGYVASLGPASGSEFALIPADNATGNFTRIIRRFPVRIRLAAQEPQAALLRPGMSARVAVAVEGDSVGECRFTPDRDRQPRVLPALPPHPGLTR